MRSIATIIGNYDDPRSFGSRMRRRRALLLVRLIEDIYAEKGRCSILDLGGTENYWNIVGYPFLKERNCRITLLNVAAPRPAVDTVFHATAGDATAVDMADNAFDIVHSNSVIEHVGDWRRMLAFSVEVRRLAPRYFVQTPNYWFPWEPHFGMPLFQYLPEPTRVSLLLRHDLGFFKRCESVSAAVEAVEGIRLLDIRMLNTLFPEARIVRERFFGMTKSLIVVRE